MVKKLQELFSNKKHAFIAILIVSIGLIMTVSFSSDNAAKSETSSDEITMGILSDELEERIVSLCERVEGVSDVRVMLTLDTSEEYVYAKDIEESDSYTKSQYATVTSDDGSLKLYVICPRVRGVAIVCKGGEKGKVKQTLTELVSSALGISSSRVSVAGGK